MDVALQERLNLKLVNEVEKYPCLYNTDTAEYYRRNITDKAWAEVGRVVGWSGPKCKEKFKNIRAVVGRYKSKSKSGNAIKRPYYLLDAMHYVYPYIKSTQKSSAEKSEAQSETENSNILIYEDDNMYDEVKVEVEDLNRSPETCEVSLNEYLSPVPSPVPKRKKPDPLELEQRKELETSAYMDEMTALQGDHKKMFLLSLLPDLYAMDAKQTRKFKRKVLQLVDDILDDSSKD